MTTIVPTTPNNSRFGKLISRIKTPLTNLTNSNQNQQQQQQQINYQSTPDLNLNSKLPSLSKRVSLINSNSTTSLNSLSSNQLINELEMPTFEGGDWLNTEFSPSKPILDPLKNNKRNGPYLNKSLNNSTTNSLLSSTLSFSSTLSDAWPQSEENLEDERTTIGNNNARHSPTSVSSKAIETLTNSRTGSLSRGLGRSIGILSGSTSSGASNSNYSSGPASGSGSGSGSSAGIGSASSYAVDSSGDRVRRGNFLKGSTGSKGAEGLKTLSRGINRSREVLSKSLGVSGRKEDPGNESDDHNSANPHHEVCFFPAKSKERIDTNYCCLDFS